MLAFFLSRHFVSLDKCPDWLSLTNHLKKSTCSNYMKAPTSLLWVHWSKAGVPVVLSMHMHLHLHSEGHGLLVPLLFSALGSLIMQGGLRATVGKPSVQKCWDTSKWERKGSWCKRTSRSECICNYYILHVQMQKSLWFGTRGRWQSVSIICPLTARYCDKAPTHLEVLVVPLELPTQALELAAGEDGSAVLTLQLVLLLGDLGLSLL